MIASRRLRLVALSRWFRRTIVLEGEQLEQVSLKPERTSIPHKTIDAVTEQRHVEQIVRVGPGSGNIGALALLRSKRVLVLTNIRAARPIQVHAGVAREIWVQGDTEQPSLRREVDGEVERRRVHLSVDDALNFARVPFEDQHAGRPDEGDAGRSHEIRDVDANPESPVEHGGVCGLCGNSATELVQLRSGKRGDE